MSFKPKQIDEKDTVRGKTGYFEPIEYSKISRITTYPVESKIEDIKNITDEIKESLDTLIHAQSECNAAQDLTNTEFKNAINRLNNATCMALEVQCTLIDMQIYMHNDLAKSKRELRAAKAASWRNSLHRR